MLNKVLSNLFCKLESLWAEDTLNTLLSIYRYSYISDKKKPKAFIKVNDDEKIRHDR